MKKKLAIATDKAYACRLCAALEKRYPDALEIFPFDAKEAPERAISLLKPDVILADEEILAGLPPLQNTAILRLSDGPACESEVSRYSGTEEIYRRISGCINAEHGKKNGGNAAKTFLFSSAQGGCGNSSVAAAFASRLALDGKRCLYLNLEAFASAADYLSEEAVCGESFTHAGINDILFASVSGNPDISGRIRRCEKTDRNGVLYYGGRLLSETRRTLTDKDAEGFLRGIAESGGYDAVVIDTELGSGALFRAAVKLCDSFIAVCTGSRTGISKTRAAFEEISAEYPDLADRIYAVHNMRAHAGETITDFRILCSIPLFEGLDQSQVIAEICRKYICTEDIVNV